MPNSPTYQPIETNHDPVVGQYFVLSIAINYYQSDHVSNLQACVNDANQLKRSLQNHFDIPEVNYKVLLNKAATRKNIIDNFRNHFSQLKDGDTAIFHFSGHGSWEETSPGFVMAGLEHYGGRNEVLVVHDYGRDGILNIADKELRWLIHELQYPTHQPPRKITFLGLIDCCFSGTIFRNEHNKYLVRRTELDNTAPRKLTEYLEGQYAQQPTLAIPKADFLLFSACGPREYALENRHGGLFSQALSQIFKGPASLSYADAFFYIRNAVQVQSNGSQNPYFEYVGEANPFQIFLGTKGVDMSMLPLMMPKGNEWIVRIGALHGISMDQWKNNAIPIYAMQDTSIPIAFAHLKKVGLEYTILELNGSFQESTPPPFYGGLHGQPLGMSWQIEAAATSIYQQLRQKLSANGLWSQITTVPLAPYRLQIGTSQLAIFKGNQLISGISFEDGQPTIELDFLLQQIRKIIKWEQLIHLQPPRSTEINPDKIELFFKHYPVFGDHNHITSIACPELVNEIVIPYEENQPIFYDIKVSSRDPDHCYCYLIHQSRQYGITQKLEQFIKPLRYEDSLEYRSANYRKALAIADPKLQSTTDTFTLFITRTPLHAPHLFEQAGMGNFYGKIITKADLGGKLKAFPEPTNTTGLATWSLKKINVTLIRQ